MDPRDSLLHLQKLQSSGGETLDESEPPVQAELKGWGFGELEMARWYWRNHRQGAMDEGRPNTCINRIERFVGVCYCLN